MKPLPHTGDLVPSPSVSTPLTEKSVPELSVLEADLKSRMERHANALEKARSDEVLEMMRQAEID